MLGTAACNLVFGFSKTLWGWSSSGVSTVFSNPQAGVQLSRRLPDGRHPMSATLFLLYLGTSFVLGNLASWWLSRPDSSVVRQS